jgi:hypothetical protein
MKIQTSISNQQVSFNYAGITIAVNPNEVLESIDTLRAFIEDVIPARLTKDIDTTELFDNLDKYLPLINKARQVLAIKGEATSTITISKTGKIYLSCNAQDMALDIHLLMDIIADIKDLIEGDAKEEAKAKPSLSDSDKKYEDYLTNIANGNFDANTISDEADILNRKEASVINGVKYNEEETE